MYRDFGVNPVNLTKPLPGRDPPQDLRIHARAHRSLIRLDAHERCLPAPADLEFELRSINRSLQGRRYLFHRLRLLLWAAHRNPDPCASRNSEPIFLDQVATPSPVPRPVSAPASGDPTAQPVEGRQALQTGRQRIRVALSKPATE